MKKFWRSMIPMEPDAHYNGSTAMTYWGSWFNGAIGMATGCFLAHSPWSPLYGAPYAWMFYVGAFGLGAIAAFGYRRAVKRYRKFEKELKFAVADTRGWEVGRAEPANPS